MESKYTAIFKLKEMLDKANIEYEFYDRMKNNRMKEEREKIFGDNNILKDVIGFYSNKEFYQIIIRNNEVTMEDCFGNIEDYESYSRLASIIQGFGTYGENLDLLEVNGKIVRNIDDTVEGYLTAEEVFKRIKEEINNT